MHISKHGKEIFLFKVGKALKIPRACSPQKPSFKTWNASQYFKLPHHVEEIVLSKTKSKQTNKQTKSQATATNCFQFIIWL